MTVLKAPQHDIVRIVPFVAAAVLSAIGATIYSMCLGLFTRAAGKGSSETAAGKENAAL